MLRFKTIELLLKKRNIGVKETTALYFPYFNPNQPNKE